MRGIQDITLRVRESLLQNVNEYVHEEALIFPPREALQDFFNESKFFIEWTALEAGTEAAAELVELQVQLASWQRRWAVIWADGVQRRAVAKQSGAWSARPATGWQACTAKPSGSLPCRKAWRPAHGAGWRPMN